MAISIPTNLATLNSNTSGQTSWATASITFPANSLGIVMMGCSIFSGAITWGVSDGGPNTWAVDIQQDGAGGVNALHSMIGHFYFASSQSVVVTTTFGSVNERFGWIGYVTGTSTTPLDQTGSTDGNSVSTYTCTTGGNLAVDGEIGFHVCTTGGITVLAVPAGWTAIPGVASGLMTDGTRSRQAIFCYDQLAAGSGASLSTGANSTPAGATPSASIATYMPSTSAATPPAVLMAPRIGQ